MYIHTYTYMYNDMYVCMYIYIYIYFSESGHGARGTERAVEPPPLGASRVVILIMIAISNNSY